MLGINDLLHQTMMSQGAKLSSESQNIADYNQCTRENIEKVLRKVGEDLYYFPITPELIEGSTKNQEDKYYLEERSKFLQNVSDQQVSEAFDRAQAQKPPINVPICSKLRAQLEEGLYKSLEQATSPSDSKASGAFAQLQLSPAASASTLADEPTEKLASDYEVSAAPANLGMATEPPIDDVSLHGLGSD